MISKMADFSRKNAYMLQHLDILIPNVLDLTHNVANFIISDHVLLIGLLEFLEFLHNFEHKF